MHRLFLIGTFLLAGCAGAVEEEEDVAQEESELAYGKRAEVQLYNANLKHLSEPGKPSFEGTDYTQLLRFMKKQELVPDILALQEVGTKRPDFTSQSCASVLADMDRLVRPAAWRTKWKCIVADGSLNGLGNSPGGVAIVYRGRFEPRGAKKLVGLYKWTQDGCKRQKAGDGWTALVQRFDDGKNSIAVASVHLPTAGDGNNNATDDDCSGKNLRLVEAALAATKADVKVMAGDMNHGDATRHIAGGNVVHDHWEASYENHNAALSDSKYRDPFFDKCNGSSQCLEAEHWTMNNAGELDSRIDWVLVAGAKDLRDAKTISYAEVNPQIRYSDHRAHMVRIVY